MNYYAKFRNIRSFIFDVDGVLTDGTILVSEEGDLLRNMNIRDGYAIKKAINQGYNVAVITGGKSQGVVHRLNGLGVKHIYTGVSNKLITYRNYIEEYDINPLEILYMGDDLPDFEVMTKVAVAACPSDAAHEIREIAHFISPVNGGKGCARDVIEKVLRIQDNWLD